MERALTNVIRFATPGIEVIVIEPSHPKYGSIGITAGLADTIAKPRIRVMIGEVEIYLCDSTDLAEN